MKEAGNASSSLAEKSNKPTENSFDKKESHKELFEKKYGD